jgi:very-short-patch-repair endonuclease
MLPWPFIGAEALASAAIPERAMRRNFEQVYPGVYVPTGVEPSPSQRAEAAWLWSGRRGVVAGQSAAALLGVKWIDRSEPAELIHDNRRPPARLVVRNERPGAGECCAIGAMRVTTAARTSFDIGRHTPSRVRSVRRLDAIANATGVTVADVEEVIATHRGARGLGRLRRVLPLVDPGAESPQETVARLALVDAGLPKPRTQFQVFGRYGEFIARLDMAYDEVKVGIEYDGAQHWTDPVVRQRDIDKQFELTDMGWNVIRVSNTLLHQRRATYVARVVAALSERGLRW